MILAVASGGGHFVQLKGILTQFSHEELHYVSTIEKPILNSDSSYSKVIDCNISSIGRVLFCFVQFVKVFFKVRPEIVITTGAAPGFLALVVGKIFGCKTVWIDSIANADQLSLAGQKARIFADVWLTQWPELSSPHGPDYVGSVL
jgi:UDP-N-acetylglucosamine:LPS N-acetylglucosamine transferase